MEMENTGRLFLFSGLVFLLLGLIFNIMPNLPKVPGDVYIDKPNIKIYIPWLSSLVVSVILTVIFNYFR